MTKLVNMHLIETDEKKFKFTILVNDIVFTDKKIYNNMKEAIEAAVELSYLLENNALTSIQDIKEWEK